MSDITVWAPGRVNLIGDHTDYVGGLVLPMAVQLGTTVTAERDEDGPGPGRLVLRSDRLDGTVDVELPVVDAAGVEPAWGRYAAGVAQELGATVGLDGTIRSDLPIGGGLSSSASLEVAVALALGAEGTPLEIARLCQRAEAAATGVPCGIMDQLAVAAGVDGHALLIDCSTDEVTPVRVPDAAAVWVVDSGQPRELAGSEYPLRRAQAEAAAEIVGALPHASMADVEAIDDPVLRARARHVRTECDRVRAFAAAVAAEDLVRAGELMVESHRSLRDDYEVSTPVLDDLVEQLVATPGVHGARLTGAGFGGCVVALADRGIRLPGTRVRPTVGATVFWD
ncbi:galactokinase [Dermatobacter hominis]|uniref:galactokinase n=1 Tax=Dermatobacter hominis TaxID=2884263 RepID=UPI001D0F4BEB|nr:galactokinase [Dermatobacter hominis]UDY36915.1 galactokinase [Dermatobacter hominis]